MKGKCTDGISFRMRRLVAVCAINVLYIAAVADTYYWLPERGVKADASNLTNWSIEFDSETKTPVADAHPTRMPTASDELCATRDFHFDFNGDSLTFKSMNAAAISPYTGITYWSGPGEGWTFENGSLSVGNLTQRIRTGDRMLLTNGVHLTCSEWFSPGNGMGADGICDVDIADGCTLVAAKTAFANGHINIAEGGSFSTELLQNSGAQSSCVLENMGSAKFGRIDITSTAPASYRMTIRQLLGTMTFGGQVSRNGGSGGLALEMSGGTMQVTGDVSFNDVTRATVTSGTAMDIVVDSGCSLDMGRFTYGDGVVLRKIGRGELCFGDAVPSSLVVADGALHAIGAGAYGDYVSVESGGELHFMMPGISCTAFAFQDGAKCSINVGNFPSGSTILQCESDDTLVKVKALLETWLSEQGSDRTVTKVGDTLVLSYAADGTFDAASGLAFDDPKGWTSGAVPAAGSEVEVSGIGVVDITSSSPAFGLIRVAGGAILRLSGGTEAEPFEMPVIQLAADAGLTVANGAYVRYADNSMVCLTRADSMPTLTIERGATLFAVGTESSLGNGGVANDIVFKNVDMRVYGTIVTPIADTKSNGNEERVVTLWLGTADPGETTYFAFTGDGGSIFLRNDSWTYGHAALRLCCAQPGGIVETPRTLTFKDFSFPQYDLSKTINGFFAGINNSQSATRALVEAENTVFDVSDTSEVGGNVDMVFSRGGTLKRAASYFLYSVGFTLSGSATLTFREGSRFAYGRCGGNASRPGMTFKSTGVVSLDGATLQPWIVDGSHCGSLRISGNSHWNLADFLCDNTLPDQTNSFTVAATPVFTGFRDVELCEGAVLDITGVYDSWRQADRFLRTDWGREIAVAEDVPMKGAGSILVSNSASGDTMTVTVCCPSNTATGSAQASVGQRAKLRFADGANWAGTVVANGCAELFNADGDGMRMPSGATFGAIKFAGTFPLCIWKDGGVVYGDRLDLCSAVSGSGAFRVVPQDGAEFAVGDGYDFGTYPAGAKLPSVVPNPWWFEARPCDEDDTLVILRLVYKPHGLMMTIR